MKHKGTVVAMVATFGLATGVGLSVAGSAPAAPSQPGELTAVTSVAAVAASGQRGLCIQNNTGLPFYLPLVNGQCPVASGSNPGYWLSDPPFGIVARTGPQGPAGPAGPQGERGPRGQQGPAGDSHVVAERASMTLTASSPATQTLTVRELPAYTTGMIEFAGNNAEARPTGSTVSVVPVNPSGGSTSRSFTVKQTGLGSNSFTLTVTVISFK
jgi:hypothetical protein